MDADLVERRLEGRPAPVGPTRIVVAGERAPIGGAAADGMDEPEPPRVQLIRDASAVGIAIIVVLLIGPTIFASRTGAVLGETSPPEGAAFPSGELGASPGRGGAARAAGGSTARRSRASSHQRRRRRLIPVCRRPRARGRRQTLAVRPRRRPRRRRGTRTPRPTPTRRPGPTPTKKPAPDAHAAAAGPDAHATAAGPDAHAADRRTRRPTPEPSDADARVAAATLRPDRLVAMGKSPLLYCRGRVRSPMIEPGRGWAYVVLFSEIGISLLVTTLVGVLVGYWVDEQLGTLPSS